MKKIAYVRVNSFTTVNFVKRDFIRSLITSLSYQTSYFPCSCSSLVLFSKLLEHLLHVWPSNFSHKYAKSSMKNGRTGSCSAKGTEKGRKGNTYVLNWKNQYHFGRILLGTHLWGKSGQSIGMSSGSRIWGF
jgi:hypothetical protein